MARPFTVLIPGNEPPAKRPEAYASDLPPRVIRCTRRCWGNPLVRRSHSGPLLQKHLRNSSFSDLQSNCLGPSTVVTLYSICLRLSLVNTHMSLRWFNLEGRNTRTGPATAHVQGAEVH